MAQEKTVKIDDKKLWKEHLGTATSDCYSCGTKMVFAKKNFYSKMLGDGVIFVCKKCSNFSLEKILENKEKETEIQRKKEEKKEEENNAKETEKIIRQKAKLLIAKHAVGSFNPTQFLDFLAKNPKMYGHFVSEILLAKQNGKKTITIDDYTRCCCFNSCECWQYFVMGSKSYRWDCQEE